MSVLTDEVNAMLLATSPEARLGIATSFASFSRQLDDLVQLDMRNGTAEYDERAVRAAAETLQRASSYAVGAGFAEDLVANLRGGFAVLGTERADALPWRVLADPVAVRRLPANRLEALGINGGSADVVRTELVNRYGSVPPELDLAASGRLVNALADQRIRALGRESEARLVALLPSRPGAATPLAREGTADETAGMVFPALRRDDQDGEGEGGGGGGGAGGGLGGIIKSIAELVPEFVTGCGPKVAPHWPTISTGFGIELDRDCTLRLANILRLGGAPVLATAGTAALAAGTFAAAVAAAVAAVGGWAVLIVAVCAIAFSFWLDLVVTEKGACIHFPWWAGFGPIPYGL